MEEKTSKEELSRAAQASVAQDAAGDKVPRDPDLTRTCCGSPIRRNWLDSGTLSGRPCSLPSGAAPAVAELPTEAWPS